VQVLTRSGELVERTPTEYETGYRSVVLQGKWKVESGKLENSDSPLPARHFPEEFFVGAWLSFQPGDGKVAIENIKALLAKRIASQPLNLPNAGSVFRNPPGDHAARLIEQCGLKGMRIGGAQVSEKHANFIVNTGGATAADIESLIDEVRGTVAKRTGVQLHPEVKIVGEAAWVKTR
jgi:UDP-N-acetylmuramate dehydrogenase